MSAPWVNAVACTDRLAHRAGDLVGQARASSPPAGQSGRDVGTRLGATQNVGRIRLAQDGCLRVCEAGERNGVASGGGRLAARCVGRPRTPRLPIVGSLSGMRRHGYLQVLGGGMESMCDHRTWPDLYGQDTQEINMRGPPGVPTRSW